MSRASLPTLHFAGKTDPGRVRALNEDALAIRPDAGFAIVADGMGGYNAGEVASGIATAVLSESLEERLQDPIAARGDVRHLHHMMVDCIAHASASIHEAARQEPRFQGMGTTLVVALFHAGGVSVAHVGDSRAYRFREGALTRLTRDHSFLQEQLDAGLITPEQARKSVDRNIVTRALGVDPEVQVEIHLHDLRANDVILLCSDGLNEMLSDQRIAAILQSHAGSLEAACDALVDAANQRGGLDNIAVVLVRIDAGAADPSTGIVDRLSRWLAT